MYCPTQHYVLPNAALCIAHRDTPRFDTPSDNVVKVLRQNEKKSYISSIKKVFIFARRNYFQFLYIFANETEITINYGTIRTTTPTDF